MKKILLILLLTICVALGGCTLDIFGGSGDEPISPASAEMTTPALSALCRAVLDEIEHGLFINNIISGMSLEEKAAQLFIVRCPADHPVIYTTDYQPGGYIFFARDFENSTASDFVSLAASCQQAAKIPLLMGVDEEGGTVNRISSYSQYRATPFLSPQDLYASGGMELIISDAQEKAALLKSLGINLNFAPVADVSTNSADYIYDRSFGQDGTATAEYVTAVVQTMQEANIGSVLKHFPGYGNNIDTHGNIAVDNRSLDSFRTNDFLPFIAGIEAGASMVLVSHNIVNCIDSQLPASLSPAVHQLLREELGFGGVIITDDLSMGAITLYSGSANPAVLAVLAGNDLLCTSDFVTQHQAILAAIDEGVISEDQLDRAIRHTLKLKIKLGLIEEQ